MTGIRGRGQPVMYLDFDGVLHPENVWRHPKTGPYIQSPPGHSLFEHNDLLEALLRQAPEVNVVLSTSWSRVFGHFAARKRLTQAVRARVVGSTFHSGMDAGQFAARPRWEQILLDVRRRQPIAWLAVDDDVADWPTELRRWLVESHPVHGIGEPDVCAVLGRRLLEICGRAQ